MSVYEIETYLNRPGSIVIHVKAIAKQETYIMALYKLQGLHILNNAIKPVTITAIDDIVTKIFVVIGINIW